MWDSSHCLHLQTRRKWLTTCPSSRGWHQDPSATSVGARVGDCSVTCWGDRCPPSFSPAVAGMDRRIQVFSKKELERRSWHIHRLGPPGNNLPLETHITLVTREQTSVAARVRGERLCPRLARMRAVGRAHPEAYSPRPVGALELVRHVEEISPWGSTACHVLGSLYGSLLQFARHLVTLPPNSLWRGEGRGRRTDACAHFKEEETESQSQHWGVAETGFEPGSILPVVVMTLSTPAPHSNEPLGTEGLGMSCEYKRCITHLIVSS